MIENARRWRILAGGVAAGMAAVLGFAGNTAAADPAYPLPAPAPATVTHTVTVLPGAAAASQSTGQLAVAPAAPAAQSLAAPGLVPAAAAAAAPETLVPAPSVTFADYFKEKGVKLEPQVARDFKALNIVLPDPARLVAGAGPERARRVRGARRPGRWRRPLHLQRGARRLQVGRRHFDPKDAISHGFIDSPAAARVAHHRTRRSPTSAACRPRRSRAPTARTT